jgi:hypothetical protein
MAVNHRILSPARLPVPPLSREIGKCPRADRTLQSNTLGFIERLPYMVLSAAEMPDLFHGLFRCLHGS